MLSRRAVLAPLALLAFLPLVACQSEPLPSSWPHDYPGKPTGDFSPAWQNYFRVTDRLPNVTFPLSRSYAGNLPINRGSPNNTLFFWGFEKSPGSLTTVPPRGRPSKDPWAIWLNGGPGSSSFYGLFFQNGPIRIGGDQSVSRNRHSWDNLADYFWIDQPAGVGYATAAADGYVPDEETLGRDFMAFLSNLVKVFPSLATRPLHLTGESYAGMYIPHILKAYFDMPNPPVKIAGIAIGDGTLSTGVVFNLVPTLSVIEIFPQLIGYDPMVYKYFKEQSHLCGFDLNLTYPQTGGMLPDVTVRQPRDRTMPWTLASQRFHHSTFMQALAKRHEELEVEGLHRRDKELANELWKRDISGRVNGSLDPWYGCYMWDMLFDYAMNYTYPWNEVQNIDVYDIANVLNPHVAQDAAPFLNHPDTRKAIHAPTSKDWTLSTFHVFGNATFDPSPVPMAFMNELAANATARDVDIVLYHGNNDFLIPKLATEIVIQNTTFGGIQGFTKKPSTPWHDDTGKFAGIIHQERGWKYVLFQDTGHMVPGHVPRAAYKFARDFIFGNNQLGSVVGNTVIGGQDPKYAVPNIQAADELYLGSGKTESSWVAPAATRSAWKAFITTETATAVPTATTTSRSSSTRTRTHHHRAQRTPEAMLPEQTGL